MGKFENLLLCGAVLMVSLATAQYNYNQPQTTVVHAAQPHPSQYPTTNVQAHGQSFKLELIPSKTIYEARTTSQQSTIHQGLQAVFQPPQVSQVVHQVPPPIHHQIQHQVQFHPQPQIHYQALPQVLPQPQAVALQPLQQQVFHPQPQQIQVRGTYQEDNTQAVKYQRAIRTCNGSGQCSTLNLGPGQLDPLQQQISDATKAHATVVSHKCALIAAAQAQQQEQQQQQQQAVAVHQAAVQQQIALPPSPQPISPLYGAPPPHAYRLYDAPHPPPPPTPKGTELRNGELRPANRRAYQYTEVPLLYDPYNY